MNVLTINYRNWKFASSWLELSPKQCAKVLSILLVRKVDDFTRLFLLESILPEGFKKYFKKLTDDQVTDMLSVTDFLLKDPVKIPFQRFRVGWIWFYMPLLSNLIAIETALADNYLQKWVKTGEEKFLNKTVGILCRPAKWWIRLFPFMIRYNTRWNGDKRQRFNGDISEMNLNKISKVKIEYRLAVIWNYIQMKKQVTGAFQDLFQGSGESGSFIDCIYQVAAKGVFGDFEKTGHTSFTTLMGFLKSNKNVNKPNTN